MIQGDDDMNVTVFGGAGFLGSHVADVLTDRGHKVLIFDKEPSTYLKEGQEMMVGDVLDTNAVKEAVKNADIVYNFIAVSDIEIASTKPIETAHVNIIGNMNILEACKNSNIKRFVFSSSVYVYSASGSFYRSSKQACELFIEDYSKKYGLEYTILRYGSLYGPRSSESNWIYRVLKQALLEGKVKREGDGGEIREYIHVYDAAKLSVDILADEYKNRCYLITGNEQIKIKDLLIMIQEILKGQVEIEFVPAKSNSHYEITPYVFKPQMAYKLKSNQQVDMGEGILNILDSIHRQYITPQTKEGLRQGTKRS